MKNLTSEELRKIWEARPGAIPWYKVDAEFRLQFAQDCLRHRIICDVENDNDNKNKNENDNTNKNENNNHSQKEIGKLHSRLDSLCSAIIKHFGFEDNHFPIEQSVSTACLELLTNSKLHYELVRENKKLQSRLDVVCSAVFSYFSLPINDFHEENIPDICIHVLSEAQKPILQNQTEQKKWLKWPERDGLHFVYHAYWATPMVRLCTCAKTATGYDVFGKNGMILERLDGPCDEYAFMPIDAPEYKPS